MSCPLCRERKGKRPCPAKGASICSACCGSKRLTEIDCPADCVYLTGAHAGAWTGRETERARDQGRIAPHVQDLSEAQLEIAFMGIVGIGRMRRDRRELTDRLVLDALQALRKTVETRGHGILYEHDPADMRAQGVSHDLRVLFETARPGTRGANAAAGGLLDAEDARRGPLDEASEPSARGPDDRDLLPALQALEAMLLAAAREGGTTTFLETSGRIAAELQREARPSSNSLILPP